MASNICQALLRIPWQDVVVQRVRIGENDLSLLRLDSQALLL